MKVAAIVGDGAAGTTAAFYLRRQDPGCRIEMYCDEPTPAYYRAALTNYMLGELKAEQLFAVPPTFFEDFSIVRVRGRVTKVDPEQNLLTLDSGRTAGFDRLLVASGARPRVPAIPGSEAAGFMAMRTMQDARTILDQLATGAVKRAVVVGGGILGLELVSALRSRGAEVTYVVRGNLFMAGVLDRVASDLVLSRCRHFGVDLRLSEEVAEVQSKSGRVVAVKLKASGEVVKTSLVVVAAGIQPNIELLEGSGVRTGKGVLVDSSMASSVPNVYAAGDVAEVPDPTTGSTRLFGLWEPARHQGRVAGMNMAGGSETWLPGVAYDATRLYDLDLAVAGSISEKAGDDVLVDFPDAGEVIAYRKLLIRGGRLAGALLIGHRHTGIRARGRTYRKLIGSLADVSDIRDSLLDPFFDLSGWAGSLGERSARPAMKTIMGARPRAPEPAGGRRSLAVLMGGPDDAAALEPAAAGAPRSLPRPTLGPSALPVWLPDAFPIGPRKVLGRLSTPRGVVELLERETCIGRDPGAGLPLDDPAVSWHHALISVSGGDVYLRDLGSRNGTFVNSVVVTLPHALHEGDVIHLGNTDLMFGASPASTPGRPKEARFWALEVTGGPAAGRRIQLDVLPLVIGSKDSPGVAGIDDKFVSGRHIELSSTPDGGVAAKDLGSTNGTRHNGSPMVADVAVVLSAGDELRLGPETVLKVERP